MKSRRSEPSTCSVCNESFCTEHGYSGRDTHPGHAIWARLAIPAPRWAFNLPLVKLPNGAQAYADPGKIRDYLLASEHLVGRHKARTFRRLGFERRNWDALHRDVLRIARQGTVVDRMLTIHGIKYVVDDRINGPAGSAVTRTVWLVERGQAVPRLVTAYHIGGVDEGT